VVERRQRHLIKGSNARAMAAPATETFTQIVVAADLRLCGLAAPSRRHHAGSVHPAADHRRRLLPFLTLLLAAQSLRQVANLQTVFSEGFTAARRLFAALDVAPTIVDPADAKPLPAGDSAIALDHVSFSYGAEIPALSDVSIEARKGETVALVGPSGGGKSSILNLIPRFYDVTAAR
jgi:subfamily B ATP-binding cassette protein MsbA